MIIEPGSPDQVALLGEIEKAADAVFDAEYAHLIPRDDAMPLELLRDAAENERLWVAQDGGRIVGFVFIIRMGKGMHIEQISVLPDEQGNGVGKALLHAAADGAKALGFDEMTLSTYRDVPWNAPLYARQGYAIIPDEALSGDLRQLQKTEAGYGLDPQLRVMMRRAL